MRLTTAQAAEELDVTPQAIRNHARDGHLRGKKFGTAWEFTMVEVRRFKEKRRGPGRPRRKSKG